MKTYQTAQAGQPLVLKEVPTPTPTGTQVLLRTVAAGVCHSDVHLHDASFDLGDGKKLPAGMPGMTLGHEIVGEVVALGPDATGVELGAVRVVYPWIGCGQCAACKREEENLCTRPANLGIGRPGGFADHVLVPHARYLIDKGRAPDGLAATYACSGLTAYSALKKVGTLRAGDHLVIIGAGGVGMNGIQIARSVFGFDPIVVDINDATLAAVKELGVTRVVNGSAPDASDQIKALTDGGAYMVIDFVGSESTVGLGTRSLRRGGRVIIVGLFGGALHMALPLIPIQSIGVVGSYVGTLPEMQELMGHVRAGKVPAIEIQERPLSAATETLDDLRHGRARGRIVLRP